MNLINKFLTQRLLINANRHALLLSFVTLQGGFSVYNGR